MIPANLKNIKEGDVLMTGMGVRWTFVRMSDGKPALRRGNVIIDLTTIVGKYGELMGFWHVEE